MPGPHEGRLALVTGASRGLGRALALRLAAEGATVALNYSRDQAGAESVLDAIAAAGGQALLAPGDVADPDAVGQLFASLPDAGKDLHLLVNNAGIVDDQYLTFMTEAQFRSVVEVSLFGAWRCTKHAARLMIRRRAGRIVNVSSVAALTGDMMRANYASAKAGLLGLTRATARELARYGITVNAILPGLVETALTADMPSPRREALTSLIPLGRFAAPEEIAGAVAWLCSDAAAYVTGQSLCVDGGLHT
jgi:3-oxoacyl-[acyl-carrier protein] reductase